MSFSAFPIARVENLSPISALRTPTPPLWASGTSRDPADRSTTRHTRLRTETNVAGRANRGPLRPISHPSGSYLSIPTIDTHFSDVFAQMWICALHQPISEATAQHKARKSGPISRFPPVSDTRANFDRLRKSARAGFGYSRSAPYVRGHIPIYHGSSTHY